MLCTRTLRIAVLVCAVSLPALYLVGCGALPPEVSAMTKVATGQMNTLTGTEVQALATTFAPEVVLTEPQADAIAGFFADNNIATMVDLQNLILKAQQDPSSVTLPEGFMDLFKDFQLPGAPATQPA